MKLSLRNHGYEFFITLLAQLSFQLFTLLIFRQLSSSLTSASFGFVGLWLTFNTSISIIYSSPISALALRFSGFNISHKSISSDDACSSYFPLYLKKLCNVFFSRYLQLCKCLIVLAIPVFFMNSDLFIALLLSIIYGLSFGLTIILIGFLQGIRKRPQQLLVSLTDGVIRLSVLVVLSKVGFPGHIFAMFCLTAGSVLSCIIIYFFLPFVLPELFLNLSRFRFSPALELIQFPTELLSTRESDHILSASKFGVISGLQVFLEVYVVSISYGLEASAALVILTKFAYTPSVFMANAILAYVAPILYGKSEIAYKNGRFPLLLQFFKDYSFALLLAFSTFIGLAAFSIAPRFFNLLFPSRYQYLSVYFAFFVFSGFLATLSMINMPIIETYKGSAMIYSSRSVVAVSSLVLNFSLTSLYGLNGAAISFVFSAFLAYFLFNLRFVFREIQ